MIPKHVWNELTVCDRIIVNMIPLSIFEIVAPMFMWWIGTELNLSLLLMIVLLGIASGALTVFHLTLRVHEINGPGSFL